jgi:hypothetical protein
MENNQNPNKNMGNGGNGPKMNMPKFNMNWIYFIAILALGLLWFTSGGPENSSIAKSASYSEFKVMVERGYAKKIVVNKPQGILRMYVKPEHIRDVFKQSTKQTGVDPYLEVEFGSEEDFLTRALARTHLFVVERRGGVAVGVVVTTHRGTVLGIADGPTPPHVVARVGVLACPSVGEHFGGTGALSALKTLVNDGLGLNIQSHAQSNDECHHDAVNFTHNAPKN